MLGLILFYLSMSTGLVKLKWVESMAGLMLRHMVLLFVPLTVGLMEMGQLLSKQAVAITASLLVSLVAVMVTTGLLGRWLLPALPAAGERGRPMNFLVTHPVFSIAFTLLSYFLATVLHRRWRWIPPIVAACLPIVALLLLVREPYEKYNQGGNCLTWLLGPATVALAVPMYRHGVALRRSLPTLALIVLAGSVVGMITAGGTAWLLGAPLPVVMSTIPKSVTTPIAIEVCRELKGIPQITIALVILAGVLGASFGAPLMRLVGVKDDRAIWRSDRHRCARCGHGQPGAPLGDAGDCLLLGHGGRGGIYLAAGRAAQAVSALKAGFAEPKCPIWYILYKLDILTILLSCRLSPQLTPSRTSPRCSTSRSANPCAFSATSGTLPCWCRRRSTTGCIGIDGPNSIALRRLPPNRQRPMG